jgi:hypothetical protein
MIYSSGDIIKLATHAKESNLEIYVEYITKGTKILKPMVANIAAIHDDHLLITDKNGNYIRRLNFEGIHRIGVGA